MDKRFTRTIALRVTRRMLVDLENRAHERDQRLSEVVREALRAFLSRHAQPPHLGED